MLPLLSIDETRALCKQRIEMLEVWLRRIIHSTLEAKFGAGYFEAAGPDGNPIFGNKVQTHAATRMAAQPERYHRKIDTLLLEDEIRTINKLFPDFKDAMALVFHNREAFKLALDKVAAARNPLYHNNEIRLRQAEQVYCYCGDVVESIQRHYARTGMARLYDAPIVVRFRDSLGNVRERRVDTELSNFSAGLNDGLSNRLHVGDEMVVDLEIDAAYERSTFRIVWSYPGVPKSLQEPDEGTTFRLRLDNAHVMANFDLYAYVVSNAATHRHGGFDDCFMVRYTILP